MVRAPADWRRILRRAESLVRKRDRRALDLLLPALRWRDLKARNRAVVLLGRLGPIAFQALLTVLDDARTAAERGGAADGLGRIGDSQIGLAKDLAPGREPRPKERPSGSRPVASRPPLARPESAQSGRRPPRSLGSNRIPGSPHRAG